MGLSDIAAAVGTTTQRRESVRGVASVDATDRPLVDQLAAVADDLPCSPAAAVDVVEAYADGATVGESARAGDVAPVTAAKLLHCVGVTGVSPLTPLGREVVRDWLRADLSRTEALELAGVSAAEFALGAYVETHDPVPEARDAVADAFGSEGFGLVEKRDHLGASSTDLADQF